MDIHPEPVHTSDSQTAPVSPSTLNPNTTTEPPNIASPEPPENQASSDRSYDGLRSILSTVGIIILAPLIALMLTHFIFQPYEVDGASMETTLQNQDRLIVLKVPRTFASLSRHPYIPHRGDVIIFNLDTSAELGSPGKKQLVKRVIGLPGDHIIIKDGSITIINQAHPNGFNPDQTQSYGSVIKTTDGNVDLVIPKDKVFVCGDNRQNSLDSRVFGPVDANSIVGKLELRIFPFNKLQVF